MTILSLVYHAADLAMVKIAEMIPHVLSVLVNIFIKIVTVTLKSAQTVFTVTTPIKQSITLTIYHQTHHVRS